MGSAQAEEAEDVVGAGAGAVVVAASKPQALCPRFARLPRDSQWDASQRCPQYRCRVTCSHALALPHGLLLCSRDHVPPIQGCLAV